MYIGFVGVNILLYLLIYKYEIGFLVLGMVIDKFIDRYRGALIIII